MCKNHKKLTVSTNGGLKSFGKKATRKLSPMTVHFNQNYMATILSFKEVVYILGMRITTDTNQERAITVTLQNGRFFRFKECKSGIYYCDTENKDDDSEEKNNINNNTIIDYSCIQTINENTNLPTKEEISRASKARIYQYILCCSSTTNYIKTVENNMITNCDMNSDDIKRADIIWGPAESILKGKTKRKNKVTKS